MNNQTRKIAVVTGNRAEFGLLQQVISKIAESPKLNLELIVTGAHLVQDLGHTVSEIEQSNFPYIKIPIFPDDSSIAITEIMANAVKRFGEYFTDSPPDIVLVLGDRYEIFSVVAAAVACHIPVAHCHGGEVSAGSIDNQWRHAISKMANIHFCATEQFRHRIIQMGESSEYIFNVGALGIENLRKIPSLTREQLELELGFKFRTKNILLTFHPETHKAEEQTREDIRCILAVLERFEDLGILITYPNADAGSNIIIQELTQFAQNNQKVALSKSLGAKRYASCLNIVDAVVGNSSSALIEAPSFRLPAVNIGERQNRRLAPQNVINCSIQTDSIKTALTKALSAEFRQEISNMSNPYDGGDSSDQIVSALESIRLENIIFKGFEDYHINL